MNDYRKLGKQPLVLTLAEFRYSPVLNIAELIPTLQEQLRAKYPHYSQRSDHSFVIRPGGIDVNQNLVHTFISADKMNAVEVTTDKLIYFTSDYPRFDGFRDECYSLLETLEAHVKPTLIKRIGLRYTDVIKIEQEEQYDTYIDAMINTPGVFDALGELAQSRNEYALKTEQGMLLIRSVCGINNLGWYPDIERVPVKINQDTQPSDRIVLDFDHSWTAEEDGTEFSVSDCIDVLSGLHEITRKAFWDITTNYARNEKWS